MTGEKTMTALDALKHYFGYPSFRGGQETLIDGILSGRDVLGIMPTGAGKSICFQLPSLMMDGVALVVSPLISLMKDQVNALTQSGVAAAYINSSLSQAQIDRALRNAGYGVYKLIYVAPERLLTRDFTAFARSANISMLAVDEAHCISQWGQDFRPSYAKIPDFIAELPKRPIVSAFTATATPKVREDILALLKLREPQILIAGFDRKNLCFGVRRPKNKYEELTAFLKDKKARSGIVYCGTRKSVESVCRRLRADGYSASRYHAGLSDEERHGNQDDFLYDRAQIMVATNAFGMGIDKSNVSFVVHVNMPKDIESYYQEAGRAGRDGSPADCLLLYSNKDVSLNAWMIENENDVEYPDKETEMTLKERSRGRLREMACYSTTTGCLRRFILNYFGESPPDNCGNCGSCNSDAQTTDITIDAQMILSCVARMGGRYGQRTVTDVLLGRVNEKTGRLGLNKLSTFGISKRQRGQLGAIIEFLAMQKYLIKTTGKTPLLQLGELADNVLRKGAKLEMFLAENLEQPTAAPVKKLIKKPTGKPAKKIMDEALFEALKDVRRQISKEEGVPAFIIFSDSTLAEMCAKKAKTSEALLKVSGVGDVKLERYGERFLNAIKAHSEADKAAATAKKATLAKKAIPAKKAEKAEPAKPPVKKAKARKISKLSNAKKSGKKVCKKRKITLIASSVKITDKPVPVSTIAERINGYLAYLGLWEISAAVINKWLVSEGYIDTINDKGKNRKISTDKGMALGILTDVRKVGGERVRVNMFDRRAQEVVAKRFCGAGVFG
jgi:ATP-dependent DNA helicase RecQ